MIRDFKFQEKYIDEIWDMNIHVNPIDQETQQTL